ncbi:DUF1853 family protein [Vibrio sinaloensis]|uniref:DUF1853 family protein n=1 Tax=Photobacterium sp. (strain ATCC 43367) TaxID=379097 RepID=UPI0005803DD8|nr:DUF1853 family protein [Vibrio sinaloensis]KHT46293.1 type II citrate synthase [Vibrio sinaloensis]
MNALERFYHWVHETPSLFEITPPFVDIKALNITPLKHDDYQGNPRLGFIYQHLCTELLRNSEEYSLLEEEIQINKTSGQTLGAIDLILKNRQSQQNEHWEVAIKFYLLHQGIWYGPNAHDQLDKKLARMLSHQLKMSASPEFLEQYPHYSDLTERLLIQGRLYINPFSPETTPKECLGLTINPSQITGYWCYQSQWELIDEPLYELEKPLWAIGQEEFNTPIDKPNGRFVHAQTQGGQFWFVVPDSWPN